MCHRIGRRRLSRRSTPLPLPPPQPPASFADTGGAWITRRDLLTVLGALNDAAFFVAMHGKGGDFGRYRALARALGDDR